MTAQLSAPPLGIDTQIGNVTVRVAAVYVATQGSAGEIVGSLSISERFGGLGQVQMAPAHMRAIAAQLVSTADEIDRETDRFERKALEAARATAPTQDPQAHQTPPSAYCPTQ